ncbi:MAG: phosphoribosyltransferase-like protein [Bryobacteraceae bacterium]
MWSFLHGLKAALRFRDYQPQHVSMASLNRWIKQLKTKEDQKLAWMLLDRVIYLSEHETKQILVHQNNALMENLRKAGLPSNKLIYISTDDAASSSPMMLGMLRNAALLEQQGCKFRDGRDAMGINKITAKVQEGAIVYIDDFVGSGNQFNRARSFLMENVVGTFSEFLLVPSICEEGYARITDLGVTVYAGHIHSRAERPLHHHSHLMHGARRDRLIEICKGIRPNKSLGFDNLATMVVLYRNAPNTIPAILRGSDKQTPFYGLFPRFKDLPVNKN